MTERIDQLQYDTPLVPGTTPIDNDPFFNGPGEFLCKAVADQLLLSSHWTLIFGDRIDPYRREDYSERELPALRIYNERGTKEFDSWFIEGDLMIDLILPASIRRIETQQIPDSLVSALIQQFRRPNFFKTLYGIVPGLNELGRRVTYDKSLGFQWTDTVVPLTQITVNFRIDLREWDEYLESTNRTKDDPFDPVITDLTKIASVLQGLQSSEQEDPDVEISTEQKPGIPPTEA